MNRKIISLLLSAVMLLSMLSVPSVAMEDEYSTYPEYGPIDDRFIDVDTGDGEYRAIEYVCYNGFIMGVSDNRFSPNTQMTRAMVVTAIGRLAETLGESVEGYTNSFGDVEDNQWYTEYVSWASAKGIVEGYSDTRFGTDSSVSRQDMAVLIMRLVDYMQLDIVTDGSVKYEDDSEISGYARVSVDIASRSGIVHARGGKFCPQEGATRYEVAQVFFNLCWNMRRAYSYAHF